MSLPRDRNNSSTDGFHDMLASLQARLDRMDARANIQDDLDNTRRLIQRMHGFIVYLRGCVERFEDELDYNGGTTHFHNVLAKQRKELLQCIRQQCENISHARFLEQKLHDLENEESSLQGNVLPLHDDGLELQSLQEKSDCVTLEFDGEQPKVCDNYNLELALDLDSTNGQHVGNEKVSLDMICGEDLLEQIPACISLELLDNVTIEDIHVLEQRPFVPSALHVQDVEFIGDLVAEIEPEPPPITCSMLLDFVDPMLQVSCHLIPQDLRTNLFEGGGNDTTMKGKLGAILECEDHHQTHKGRFDTYGVYGLHGVAWKLIEAHLCLWESMEAKWMKNKHVKKKKGYV